ncbi:MAG TPA: DNA (cytosine-5-)-methyltransferase [Saprospiraceae bacterium]|nr:DNA (cytosine-5-)-methyltransferase [Saprospiraceae bacterium]
MNLIDLFAGAGGLSEGFIRNGFRPVAHVEADKAACFTLKTRMAYHWLKANKKINIYKDYLRGKITRAELYNAVPEEVLSSVIHETIGDDTLSLIFSQIDHLLQGEKVDIIVGGPPCQAYSVVGRARDKNRMQYDSRNYLYRYYARFLKKYQPKIFVFENVTGLASAAGGKYLKDMRAYFRRIGYELDYSVLNAADFGVLQNRKRILLIGWKKGIRFKYPEFPNKRLKSIVNVLFRDLPPLRAGEDPGRYVKYCHRTNTYLKESGIRNGINIVTQHISRPHSAQDKEIYRIAVKKWEQNHERLSYSDLPERLRTHKNRNSFLDRFKVVAGDELCSQTIVAHIAKDGHYYIHPDIGQNRSISVREAARLQSFPDDYCFEGRKESLARTAAFKQIGNAVPPVMAEVIANQLIRSFPD